MLICTSHWADHSIYATRFCQPVYTACIWCDLMVHQFCYHPCIRPCYVSPACQVARQSWPSLSNFLSLQLCPQAITTSDFVTQFFRKQVQINWGCDLYRAGRVKWHTKLVWKRLVEIPTPPILARVSQFDVLLPTLPILITFWKLGHL